MIHRSYSLRLQKKKIAGVPVMNIIAYNITADETIQFEAIQTWVKPKGQSRTKAFKFVTGSTLAVYPGMVSPYWAEKAPTDASMAILQCFNSDSRSHLAWGNTPGARSCNLSMPKGSYTSPAPTRKVSIRENNRQTASLRRLSFFNVTECLHLNANSVLWLTYHR